MCSWLLLSTEEGLLLVEFVSFFSILPSVASLGLLVVADNDTVITGGMVGEDEATDDAVAVAVAVDDDDVDRAEDDDASGVAAANTVDERPTSPSAFRLPTLSGPAELLLGIILLCECNGIALVP